MVILELIHATKLRPQGTSAFIRSKPIGLRSAPFVMTLNNFVLCCAGLRTGAASFKCLPYQLSIVGYAPTMAITGNGESGFDSGEGA